MCPLFVASDLSAVARVIQHGQRWPCGFHSRSGAGDEVRDVIARAVSHEYTWLQAAEIIGVTPRRCGAGRRGTSGSGYDGLMDGAAGAVTAACSPGRGGAGCCVCTGEVSGFNGRHFHQTVRREHGVRLSYSFVKKRCRRPG